MLHALKHRKIRLDRFRPASEADRMEDLIVSTVFGPWELLPADRQLALLCSLCKRAGLDADVLLAMQQAGSVQVEFWPRLDAGHLGRRQVEPDVLWRVDLKAGATLLLMLEAKWNSPLGEQQLEQQRAALARNQPNARIVHLLLTRRRSNATAEAVRLASGAGDTGWVLWDDVLSTLRTHWQALHLQVQPLMRMLAEWEFVGVDVGRLADTDLSNARAWQVQAIEGIRWPSPAALPQPLWRFHTQQPTQGDPQ